MIWSFNYSNLRLRGPILCSHCDQFVASIRFVTLWQSSLKAPQKHLHYFKFALNTFPSCNRTVISNIFGRGLSQETRQWHTWVDSTSTVVKMKIRNKAWKTWTTDRAGYLVWQRTDRNWMLCFPRRRPSASKLGSWLTFLLKYGWELPTTFRHPPFLACTS